jgi:hypothetical protein
MINKELTIRKASGKYKIIYPLKGKRSLEECFFYLRGVAYFQFLTKDRKVRLMKASLTRAPVEAVAFNRETLVQIVRFINRPILVRSLFLRKVEKYTGISALCNGSELQRLLRA